VTIYNLFMDECTDLSVVSNIHTIHPNIYYFTLYNITENILTLIIS